MLFVHGHGAYLMHELLYVPVRECHQFSLRGVTLESLVSRGKVLVPWQGLLS